MALLLLIGCWLLIPLWESLIVLCFAERDCISILASWWDSESWLLFLVCLPSVSSLLCGSSSRCHGFVCILWLWFYIIILTFLIKMPGLVWILITRMPAFVACECLIGITFLSSLDPDQALQSAAPDLEPHCVISKCVSNIYILSPYFLCNPL